MHILSRCLGSFVAVIELLQSLEVIVRSQQLLAFNAEGARDTQSFMTDAAVESQERIQLIRREEVPVSDRAADAFLIGMILEYFSFNVSVHAAVNAANALHQAHRVPVQIIVN